MSLVLLPIPSRDFDPSEVAVSWKILTQRGHRVVFATPDGKQGACDPIMLSGIGLDPWSGIPVLRNVRVLGFLLSANTDARSAYVEMLRDPAFASPLRWDRIESTDFDGLLLGGGHWARGMREYLESTVLQRITAEFFAAEKPVAAICHGVLLAARSTRADGLSVLHGRKTTALTWALERKASTLAHVGRFWDRNYYRTYTEAADQPTGYMSVQQEVTRALASSADFIDVRESDPEFRRKTSGTVRDTATDDRPAWVVRDENYVSARWPGDVHSFARTFAAVLEQ
ncbi:putative intracellular protease/amidase [Burkholderia sp. Ch1-1]|uniref:Intracellular protease/amidase n=1 Tax=Paraburkholderia dioscoreae TaxID=2604047 RepID=A0A5Q4YW23_9BURK|nr:MULTISPECIES: type 1 glutamine amidotransferase domain-containing protein [Paraburkholderia]EIF33945.1 putative intracellular protease/amidase [Burkholderia sp. Ch1-1]MDR8396199.1 type 1 glutamine amidotransferase domain-containing protein [Paraburkholderia sp. USG1]VVD32855.1 Putative intracellular protease/amidase [Paraburkholderia dioscoreae]